jgi:hypothetical protein
MVRMISYGTGVENINPRRDTLALLLETSGGYIEVAQRIAETLRHHYDCVDFIIPNFAMSAGTVLVMSGNSIYMDYYSVLGPIDPQVQRHDAERMVPALGYLVQYERLIAKSHAGTLTTAELAYLIDRFDPAELYRYEQARQLSITLLKEWLVKYKFRDWTRTERRKKKVTETMKSQRAAAIARLLNRTDRWHSHSRGISMEVLRRDLKVRIEDFGSREGLNASVRSYYRLLKDYMMRRGQDGVLHTRGTYTPLMMAGA